MHHAQNMCNINGFRSYCVNVERMFNIKIENEVNSKSIFRSGFHLNNLMMAPQVDFFFL